MLNRLWNLWCSLSGTDVGDASLKVSFNVDPRVALLSGHEAGMVEERALDLWGVGFSGTQDEFLDLWVAAVTATQRVAERERQAKDAERRREAELAEKQRQIEQADKRRRREQAQAEERRRREQAQAEERRRREQAQAEGRRRREEEEARREAEAEERRRQETQRIAQVRSRIPCLYNITSVLNLRSISQHGILSHERVASIPHVDMSDHSVQGRRENRVVAGGNGIHSFASLYFNPSNAMLYRLWKKEGRDLVVLAVAADVLDESGVVVTDGNAASGASASWLGVGGLAHVDLNRVYSKSWWTGDGEIDGDLKRVTQAEVLVPGCVHPRWIRGLFAPTRSIMEQAAQAAPHWTCEINTPVFFG